MKVVNFLLILCLCLSCLREDFSNKNSESKSQNKKSTDEIPEIYDTVIVGGGFAGVTAAYYLRNKKILLLEKENRLGGRVWTKFFGKNSYELGALFGYTNKLLPENIQPPKLIEEKRETGLFLNDKLYFDSNMRNVLKKAATKKSDKDYLEKDIASIEEILPYLSKDMALSLKTAFNVIHPGNFEEYVKSRRMDSFRFFSTAHYAGGNKTIIDVYAEFIEDKYLTEAEVKSVKKKGDLIEVIYQKNNKIEKVFSKTAIIATPATVATQIIEEANTASKQFLNSVKYGKGVAVIIMLDKSNSEQFSYMITPQKSFNTIFRNTTEEGNFVYTLYFIDLFIQNNLSYKDKDYINIALEELRTMNLDNFDEKNILLKDVFFWKELGTIISQETYSNFNEQFLEPLVAVFLAGDYTFWEKDEIPYGVEPAFISGKIAARKVVDFLESGQVEKPIKQQNQDVVSMFDAKETLTVCSMYKITELQPEYIDTMQEGNIAYYALIAQAEKNKELAHRVAAISTKNYEWEYGYKYGGTSADSAIVLEALIDLDIEKEKIENAINTLLQKYYNNEQGCFSTLPDGKGRAKYWHGCSAETTAQLSFLLYLFDKEKFSKIAEKSAEWLVKMMKQEGFWKSRWFPSDTIATFYGIRLLNVFKKQYKNEISKIIEHIKTTQEKNGSWKNSVVETSAALLALKTVETKSPQISKGEFWLRDSNLPNNPEPLLYYWFESKGFNIFFNCYDKGLVSKAWKKIALDF